MKKINLKEFQSEQLSITERMNTKAGSGKTLSHRIYTRGTAIDQNHSKYDRN